MPSGARAAGVQRRCDMVWNVFEVDHDVLRRAGREPDQFLKHKNI